jgi:hypothetical protein
MKNQLFELWHGHPFHGILALLNGIKHNYQYLHQIPSYGNKSKKRIVLLCTSIITPLIIMNLDLTTEYLAINNLAI